MSENEQYSKEKMSFDRQNASFDHINPYSAFIWEFSSRKLVALLI